MRDLEDVLVLALEQAVAAPYCSCKLADAGARVIKVERPDGDFARGYDRLVHGESAYFVWLNRGKESLCLDLKQPADLALLDRILERADIFIQNLAPGAAGRLGLGAEALASRFPRLIYCSISGYGEEGPYRDQKAYDMLIQGESGLLTVNGTPEGSARVGISICDITAGMTAYAAILQSLVARERTGKGRAIEVSLFHAIADWMNVPYLQTRYGRRPPPRVGLRHPSIAPYGAFPCRDGKMLLLAVQNEREWARLCAEVLGKPELVADPRFATNMDRVRNCPELEAMIEAALGDLTREAAMERLGRAGIACSRLSDMDDLIAHPQRRTIAVQTPSGAVEMMAPGARFPGAGESYAPVPAIGQHTEALRAEFGRAKAAASG
jgi:crotonobetainyl-CoA:carnitine CoA-transferase CaiB-like acyl-CoA transferase